MTARKVDIHPEALAEAKAALAWYAERSSRAPQAFLSELDKAIETILNSPRRWPTYEADCRRFPLFRFPYLVVYRRNQRALLRSWLWRMVAAGRVIGAAAAASGWCHSQHPSVYHSGTEGFLIFT